MALGLRAEYFSDEQDRVLFRAVTRGRDCTADLRVPLPHSRARRQRHDAAIHGDRMNHGFRSDATEPVVLDRGVGHERGG